MTQGRDMEDAETRRREDEERDREAERQTLHLKWFFGVGALLVVLNILGVVRW